MPVVVDEVLKEIGSFEKTAPDDEMMLGTSSTKAAFPETIKRLRLSA